MGSNDKTIDNFNLHEVLQKIWTGGYQDKGGLNAGRPSLTPNEAEKIVQTYIDQQVTKGKLETAKAYGGCEKCYGKGYATVSSANRSFDGRDYHVSPMKNDIKYCSCDRGKQLESLQQQLKAGK